MDAALQAKERADESQRKAERFWRSHAKLKQVIKRWARLRQLGEQIHQRGRERGDIDEVVRGQKIADRAHDYLIDLHTSLENAEETARSAELDAIIYYEEYEQQGLHK